VAFGSDREKSEKAKLAEEAINRRRRQREALDKPDAAEATTAGATMNRRHDVAQIDAPPPPKVGKCGMCCKPLDPSQPDAKSI
jgi:hypothetical protein